MILDESHPNYGDLPGIWTLLGGLWVLHFRIGDLTNTLSKEHSVRKAWLKRRRVSLLRPF